MYEPLIEQLVAFADANDVGLTAWDLVLELHKMEFDMDPQWYTDDELLAIDAAEEIVWRFQCHQDSHSPDDLDRTYVEILNTMDQLEDDANE